MKNTSFYFHWISFIVGFIFGVFGVLFSLFVRTDRRDKVYSSLLGCFIGAAISFALLKLYPQAFSGLPNFR
jgi:H+/Cl- antiporter ClcA